jgi:uncharacterized protein Smg (DUF494 family)
MILERIIDLIILLMLEMKHSRQIGKKEIDKLSELGYSDNEINSAFVWIYSKLAQGEKQFSNIKDTINSHRFLDEFEKRKITPESFGYLMQLRELGIVNDFDVELLIEKIMLSDYIDLNAEEIKQLIFSHLMETGDKQTGNNRININIKETLN